MGIEDPKLRLLALGIINILILIVLRYWIFNSETFVWLLNGIPSG